MYRFRTLPMVALVAIATALGVGRTATAQTGVDRDDSRTRLQHMLADAQVKLGELDLSLANAEDRLAFEWDNLARLEAEFDQGRPAKEIERELAAAAARVQKVEENVKDIGGKLRTVRATLKTVYDEAFRLRFRDIVRAAQVAMNFADDQLDRVDFSMEDIHGLDDEIARIRGRLRSP